MRIAYVCTDPGIPVFGTKGASLHVRAVLSELLRRGHEVHLLCVRSGEGAAAQALLEAGLIVHQLPRVLGDDTAQREHSAQASDATVASLLDQIGPELVYERYALWGRTATAWAQAAEVPSILEVNAPLPAEAEKYRGLHNVNAALSVARAALGAAGTVICVSEPVRQWACAFAPDPTRVHTVPNGVDTQRITPGRPEQPLTATGWPAVTPALAHPGSPVPAVGFTTGFVGTLKPWHGVDLLIQAMSILVALDPSHRLLVVGDGPERERLQSLTRRLGLNEHVEFTGAVAESEIPALLQRMHVACAPYPGGEDFYFSPLKVYEYLAAGLPVVASRIGELPALLGHGRQGVLVTPGNVDEISGAVEALRLDSWRREQLGNAARATALEHDWSHVVDRIAGLAAVPLGRVHAHT
ncbi:glycosyltransferase family 4 protein [Kineosporia babensis]|uniref:Glycosyltransferase family 4 protein n=1 Tax=Kineosporia babensis TaxID=499548 RepID=A0A9X1SWM2_9ACTN|nr:glycosyltransferase family 4 protein [Kineosporia babensis]MCD5314904.1 glycosyltransferase family 4 protein [Kineosporia babensis]